MRKWRRLACQRKGGRWMRRKGGGRLAGAWAEEGMLQTLKSLLSSPNPSQATHTSHTCARRQLSGLLRRHDVALEARGGRPRRDEASS